MAQGRKDISPKSAKEKELAIQLASCGISQDQIALVLDISLKTLERRYGKDMAQAPLKANARVAASLYAKAIRGDNTCMIFWLKTRARWQEKTVIEHIGGDDPDKRPINIEFVSDPKPKE